MWTASVEAQVHESSKHVAMKQWARAALAQRNVVQRPCFGFSSSEQASWGADNSAEFDGSDDFVEIACAVLHRRDAALELVMMVA